MTTTPHDHRLPERVARMESDVAALRGSIEQLAQAMSAGFAEVKKAIPSGRTEWSVLAGWAAVILTIVGMVGGSVGFSIARNADRLEGQVSGIQARELGLAFERGKLAERIDNHGEALTQLDTTLQREMRLLDSAMEAKLIDLDARLQGEIARAAHVGEEDRAVLREAIDRMRELQESTRGITAEQAERLRAIERELFEGGHP